MNNKNKTKAQLIEELEAKRQRIEHLELLAEVSRITASSTELANTLNEVARLCCRAVDATSVLIATTDSQSGDATVAAECLSGEAPASKKDSRLGAVHDGFISDAPATYHIDDAAIDAEIDAEIDADIHTYLAEYDAKSVLVVPILASSAFSDTFTGYISVWESRHKRTFEPDEIRLLESVAGTVGVAVENAILYDNLRRNEVRSRMISELVSDYAYRYQLRPDGTWYRDWTTEEAFTRVTGYRREELTGAYDLYHPEERERVMQDVARTFAGHATESEYRIITKSGEERWILVHRQPEWDESGQRITGMYGAAQDITEHKQAEETIRLAETRYVESQKLARMGNWELDLETDVLAWSDSLYQLYNIAPADAIRPFRFKDALDFIHPDDREQFRDQIESSIKTGTDASAEYRVIRADGSERTVQNKWVHLKDGSKPARLFGVVQDITERKELEGYLANSVEKYLTFVEQISEGIWTLSFEKPISLDLPIEEQLRSIQRQGVISECNEAFATMYGFPSPQEVIGKTFADVHGYDDLEVHWDARYALAANGYRAGWRETREEGPDGRPRYYLNNAVGIIRDGHLHALWGTQQDITARKLAEQMIRESEERYRIVSELSSDYAFKYRVSPDGSWTHLWTTRDAFTRVTGYDPDENVEGLELYHPDDRARVREGLNKTLAGESTDDEYRIIRKDGQERWIHMRRRAEVDEKEGRVIGFYGVAEDITEQKQSADALTRERTLLRTLIDAIPEFIYVKDTESRFLVSNRAHAEGVGTTSEAIIGTRDADWFPSEMAQRFHADEQQVIQKGEALVNQVEYAPTPSGEDIWVSTTKVPLRDEKGTVIGLVGITRDITDQFKAEQTLQESERRYRAVVEDQTEMICRFLPDTTITFVNSAYCEYFGMSADELIGQSFEMVLLPEDIEASNARLAELTPDNPVTAHEHPVKLANGEVRWNRWIDRAIYDNQNRLIEYQSVGQDITESKRTEHALRISEARLAESQRIAHIGTWVWDITTDETFWSDEMYRIAGHNRETYAPNYELVLEDIHPDDRARFNATIQEALSVGRPYSLDYQVITPGGDFRTVQTRAEITKDEDGNVVRIAGTTQDITDRKRSEQVQSVLFEISRARTETVSLPELLKLIHEKLNTLIDASNFFVALYDDATEMYSFPYWVDEKDANWHPQKMPGSLTDYVRVHGEPLLVTEQRQQKLEAAGKITDRRGVRSLEWLGAPLGVASKIIGVIAVQSYDERGVYSEGDVQLLAHIADNVAWVIENKRSEEAIRRLVHRLQTLQEIEGAILKAESPEAVAQVAIQPLMAMTNCKTVIVAVLDFEQQIAIALAHTQNKPIPPLPMDLIPKEWMQRMAVGEAIIVDNLATRPQLTPFEKTIRRNGAMAFTVFPLIFNDTLVGSLTLGLDKPGKLTAEQMGIAAEVATQLAIALQQARLHEKVQEYAEHLESMVYERTAQLQEKSSEMEAFTYSVSHDLRAPLRAMDGFSRMLMSEYEDDLPERAQHYLNRIQTNARRMGILIDDLLALSRVGRHELQRKTVQTRQVVQSVLDELEANDQIGTSDIQISELPPVHADATMLRQVYFNLITNAIKYSSNNDASIIEIGSEVRDNQGVVYYVKDNGVGFDMQYADKLFGVFQRLHNAEGYEGTGIGLATVKRILTRHGGDIWATAKENEGAIFYFTFGDLPEEKETESNDG